MADPAITEDPPKTPATDPKKIEDTIYPPTDPPKDPPKDPPADPKSTEDPPKDPPKDKTPDWYEKGAKNMDKMLDHSNRLVDLIRARLESLSLYPTSVGVGARGRFR